MLPVIYHIIRHLYVFDSLNISGKTIGRKLCNLWAGDTSCWRLYLTCRGEKAKYTECYLLYFNFEFQTTSCRLMHAIYLKKKKRSFIETCLPCVWEESAASSVSSPGQNKTLPLTPFVWPAGPWTGSPVNLFRLQTGVNVRVLTQVFMSRRKVLNHICWKNSLSLPGNNENTVFLLHQLLVSS